MSKKRSKKNKIQSNSAHIVNEIELNEKIILEKNDHSLKKYFLLRGKKVYKKIHNPLIFLLKIAGGVFGFSALSLLLLFIIFGRDLPDVIKLKSMNFAETSRIYDSEGNILYNIYAQENRKNIPLESISKDAINATVAIEDKNFYYHAGFDIFGMVRAQLKNIKEDSIKQGASTITQQLAKNLFLNSERTYQRKIKELLIALQIEVLFSKHDILEMYLNKIAYGSNAFGIEAASQTFFNKSANEINLAEAAVLASLPKAPSYYSPYGPNKNELMGYCKSLPEAVSVEDNEEPENISTQQEVVPTEEISAEEKEAVKNQPVCNSIYDPNYVWGRKDFVLQRMYEDHYITKLQWNQAWSDGFNIKFIDPVHKIEAAHFVFYVKQWLEQRYGKELVESGGLQVKTTLDPRLQSIAEESVAKYVSKNARYGANNAGLVAVDPKTGRLLAMVGSIDYWNEKIDGQVNVTTSPRQPGSSFKPLVYAAAIANAGIGSGTILGDYRTVFNKKDIPKDYDGKYQGRMTIRQALGGSRNIPAIKAYYLAGEEEKVLDFVDKLGVTSLREFKNSFNLNAEQHGWTFNYGWPMSIGSGEVPLIQMVGAYSVFANEGKFNAINPILEVRDRDGNILDKFDQAKPVQVIDPQVAYIVTDMLTDIFARPAGSWRALLTIAGQNVAAKTGTSNKKIGNNISVPNNDLTIGYTPSLAAGVWVGNTDGSNLRSNAYSLYTSDPIWHDFFTAALKDKPREEFAVPDGIIKKGKEVYPNFAQFKDFDKTFRRLDSQETQVNFPNSPLITIPKTSFTNGVAPVYTPDAAPVPNNEPGSMPVYTPDVVPAVEPVVVPAVTPVATPVYTEPVSMPKFSAPVVTPVYAPVKEIQTPLLKQKNSAPLA